LADDPTGMCSVCGKPGTVHLTEIRDGVKTQRSFCPEHVPRKRREKLPIYFAFPPPWAGKMHVEFRSDGFPADADEDDEVNPGRYGKRLAHFIQRGLAQRGIDAQEADRRGLGLVRADHERAIPLVDRLRQ
jgi:hypothetical protein